MKREDLTHLKVYAIDVDEADEVFATAGFLDVNSISFLCQLFFSQMFVIGSLMMP